MFTAKIIETITSAARKARVEPAALLAVADIESAGKPFAIVRGRREPLIRFEGHYFDRRLAGDKRARARALGLAAPEAGKIVNPRAQTARWALVEGAAAIDRKAAYESVSWGIGQVMGAHWAWLGYASVEAMVEEARSGVEGQVAQMLRYIDKSGLRSALRARDWPAFARGYNGPGFRRNGYDRRLAQAYETYRDGHGAAPAGGEPVLGRGAAGNAVLGLQKTLSAVGRGPGLDGLYGAETEAAVRRFQETAGLAVDGIVGPATWRALRDAAARARRPANRLIALLSRFVKWWQGD